MSTTAATMRRRPRSPGCKRACRSFACCAMPGAAARAPRDSERGPGGAWPLDRDARRRWPERPGRYFRFVADRPAPSGAAAAVDRRASHAPPGQLVEAAGLACRQCGTPPAPQRRHPGYRLRAEALPARPLPRSPLFRPHAPLPAGAGAARGRDRALGAGQPSPAPARHLEIRRPRPARGRHRRPRRRPVAEPAPRPAGSGRGCDAAPKGTASAPGRRPPRARTSREPVR